MIHYNATIIGTYDYYEMNNKGETTRYHIQIRSGNCDSVHIWLHKEKDGMYAQLFNFIGDNEHLKNMTKNKHDIFKYCKNIKLNIYYEQNIRLMKYATKFGHKVTCYYEETK